MFANGMHEKIPLLKKKNLTGRPVLEIGPEGIRYETLYTPRTNQYPLTLEISAGQSRKIDKKYRTELTKKDRIFTATFTPHETEESTHIIKRYLFRPTGYEIESYDRSTGGRGLLFIAKEKTISEIVGDADEFNRKDPSDTRKMLLGYSKHNERLLDNIDNNTMNLVLLLDDFRGFLQKKGNRRIIEQMGSMYFMPRPGETDLPDFGEERKISSYYEDELRFILDPGQRVVFSSAKF